MNYKSNIEKLLRTVKDKKQPISINLLNAYASKSKNNNRKAINGLVLENLHLKDSEFKSAEFIDCTFKQCIFENYKFASSFLENCIFIECTFKQSDFFEVYLLNTLFKGTSLIDIDFGMCDFDKTVFDASNISGCAFNSSLISDCALNNRCQIDSTEFISLTISDSNFRDCYFWWVTFQGIYIPTSSKPIEIQECELSDCNFFQCNLINLVFKENRFSTCVFTHSSFGEKSFKGGNESIDQLHSSIDFYTIKNSKEIEFDSLKNVFGIHNYYVKQFVEEMVTEIKFYSVFISYSYKDKEFAKRINSKLNKKGVLTFLWVHDAPGGQRLKKIMSSQIKEFDKILFIASKHSLKSEACQFEIQEARKRSEIDWGDVIYPIHLDNFIFEVNEFEIPRKNRNLFWENILDLREIHSKDFSMFNKKRIVDAQFDREVSLLVKDLRKKREKK